MRSDLDPVWRALASPVRRGMLDRLREGPRTTGELAALLPGRSRYAAMQHLGVLRRAGLVVVRREGRLRWNHLNPVPIRRIHDRWVSRYDELFVVALSAVKARAEAAARPGGARSRARRAREAAR